MPRLPDLFDEELRALLPARGRTWRGRDRGGRAAAEAHAASPHLLPRLGDDELVDDTTEALARAAIASSARCATSW